MEDTYRRRISMSEQLKYRIREFIYPQDYAAAANLWRSAMGGVKFSQSDSEEEIKKKLTRDPDLFLVAECNGEIIGTVIGGFDGRRAMVYHLAVQPNFRGQGIGAALMHEVERRIWEKGALKIYLMMNSEHPELIDYYQKLGWKKMDVFVSAKEKDKSCSASQC